MELDIRGSLVREFAYREQPAAGRSQRSFNFALSERLSFQGEAVQQG